MPTANVLDTVVFVLIHGTFVPNTGWVKDKESEIRLRLRSLFPKATTKFVRFRWLGLCGTGINNAHRYRLRAAHRLKERLSRIRDNHPTAKVFIIAHSHAGNIALYAANDGAEKVNISGIVCMATPFFVVSRSNVASSAWGLVSTTLGCLFCFGGFVLAPTLVVLGLGSAWVWLDPPRSTGWQAFGALYSAAALVIAAGSNLLLIAGARILSRLVDNLIRTASRATEMRLEARLPASTPVLCLQSPGDEVGRLFFILRWITTSLRMGGGAASVVVACIAAYPLAKLCYDAMYVESVHHLREYPPHALFDCLTPVLGLLAAVVAFGAVALVVCGAVWHGLDVGVSRLGTLVSGWERLPDTLFSVIDARQSPKHHRGSENALGTRVHEVAEHEVRTWLGHSDLYANTDALDHMMAWLEAAAEERLTPCQHCVDMQNTEPKAAELYDDDVHIVGDLRWLSPSRRPSIREL